MASPLQLLHVVFSQQYHNCNNEALHCYFFSVTSSTPAMFKVSMTQHTLNVLGQQKTFLIKIYVIIHNVIVLKHVNLQYPLYSSTNKNFAVILALKLAN